MNTRETLCLQSVETARIWTQATRRVSLVHEEAGVHERDELHHHRFYGMLLRAGHNGLRDAAHRGHICARAAVAQKVRFRGRET